MPKQDAPAMTCLSCRHSRAAPGKRAADGTPTTRLLCRLLGGAADRRCGKFIYEPGTDECEVRG